MTEHWRILIRRYATVFARDRRNLAILLLQAPALAVAMAMLFKERVFAPPGHGMPNSAAQLLFVLITSVIWLGTIDAAREIVKERPIFVRERAVGVSPSSYLFAKLALLAAVAVVQAALMLGVVSLLRPLHESAGTQLALLGELALTAVVAVAFGLLISAAVRTEDQATAIIPVTMVVQLLFGGAIVTVKNMGAAIGALSTLVFERWAYAGAGRLVRMNERIAGSPADAAHNAFGTSFFAIAPGVAFVVLAIFLTGFVGGALLLLRRRDSG